MKLSYADIISAIHHIRLGRLGRYDRYSKTSYIWCPESAELWDLKPVVGKALEAGGTNSKTVGWVTTAFQPQLLRLGFPIAKFQIRRPRILGINGFDPAEIKDEHILLVPPSGDNVPNGLALPQLSDSEFGAKNANRTIETRIMRFVRDSKIASETREESDGKCDACGSCTFITAAGDWFVEVHHKKWLSEGGRDIKENLVALCPTCHRAEHHSTERKYF